MGPLSGVSCMECHQYIWKQYGVGCACSSGVVTFLWSTSRPCLASVYACSLPLMYVWAFILWSVMICVASWASIIQGTSRRRLDHFG